MPYIVRISDDASIVTVSVYRQVNPFDHLLVLDSIRNLTSLEHTPVLIDFSDLKEPIPDVNQWVLFVDHIRQGTARRIALLHSLVGQSTSCHLIAICAEREQDGVRAFQDEAAARVWLLTD